MISQTCFAQLERGQRRARPGHDVANGLEAELDKPVAYLGRQAQRGKRQKRQGLCRPAWRDDREFAVARRRPGRADRIGDTDAGMKSLRLQPRQQFAGTLRTALWQGGRGENLASFGDHVSECSEGGTFGHASTL